MKTIIGITVILFCSAFTLKGQELYDLNTVRSIYLEFENPNWHDTLTASWFEQSGHRELASLEMDGEVYDSVAIRYKGNATFYLANDSDNPKLPLNIDMNDENPDQDLLGFNKIKLANSFFDPSYLRDVLGFSIYRQYMPTPEANWMEVFVDGNYLGLYPNTESINKQFLEKHFDYKDGVLFKCDPATQFGSSEPALSPNLAWFGNDSTTYYTGYDLKSDHGWAELLNLMDILNNSPEDLETVMNVDRLIWYLAVSTAIANYDSYNGLYIHNYYLYQHENGLFQVLPWDVSESFVGILLLNGITNDAGLYNWDIFLDNDPTFQNRPLMNYVKNHPVYRKQYIAHIRTIIDEVLDIPTLTTTANDMQAIINASAQADDNAFFGIGPFFFNSNLTEDVNFFGIRVAGLLSAAQNRRDYLTAHEEVNFEAPQISNLNSVPQNPSAGQTTTISVQVENAMTVDLMVTKNKYASHFQAIQMFDDGMHNDGEAGDQIYAAEIPYTEAGDQVKYYIRAQNEEAMMLDPQRAEYVFHEYEVGVATSVFDLSLNLSELVVSPNPSEGIFNIDVSMHQGELALPLEIYDAVGRLIKTEKIPSSSRSFTLNLIGFVNGVYTLKIEGFAPSRLMIAK